MLKVLLIYVIALTCGIVIMYVKYMAKCLAQRGPQEMVENIISIILN